jgi:hypothetical protein
MSNCNKSFYINQKGEELPYGRFDVCSLPCNGWLKTRLKDIYRFIKIGENSILDLDEKEFYPIEILPDDCLIYESRKQRNRFGVWSLSENRPVLAAQYKQIFSFVPNTPHHYVVRSAEDRLQIRRDGDVLMQDLGDIRGSLPSYLLKEGSPKLIKPRFQSGEKYYVCVDLYTGQENSPDFRCVGALMDGLRYMQDGSGAQYFVNENWEKVLDFPSGLEPEAEEYKPKYTPYLFIPYMTVRNINNGRIVVESQNEGTYVMDYSGNIIIPPNKYRDCHLLGENRIYLRNKKNHGAIADINGNKLTPFAFRNDWLLHGFRQQTICLAKWLGSRRVLYGCISPDLEELIPFENEYFIDGFVDNMGVLTVDIK